MGLSLKAQVKRLIPPRLYNSMLLAFPALYRTRLVNFESNLEPEGGFEDLLEILDGALAVQGDLIECGSSRCGTTVFIAQFLARRGERRKIYACDSFEGFDREEFRSEKALGLTTVPETVFTSTSYEYVVRKIRRLGFEDRVIPIPGYFRETLPTLTRSLELCLGFVDCDLRKSVSYCAEQLWPRLNPGGILIFDDYRSPDFRGARLAIDEFVASHQGEIARAESMRWLYRVQKITGGRRA